MRVTMILLAAGRGSRFGGEVPKVYLPCAGKPVLLHSAERLCRVADPRAGNSELVLVVHPEDRERHLAPLLPALRSLGCHTIVDGGDTRQQSMARGLRAGDPAAELVLVHDAARPLFPVESAWEALRKAAEVGGALLAVPATDTLKEVTGERMVRATLDRRTIWYAQTPQAARRDRLLAALERAEREGHDATDDVALLEWDEVPVAVVPGAATNLKVTRPEDLTMAEALLLREQARHETGEGDQ